jgi:hypothetical protein
VDAQEKAGRLIFEIESVAVETATVKPPQVPQSELEQRVLLSPPTVLPSDAYAYQKQPMVPTTVR